MICAGYPFHSPVSPFTSPPVHHCVPLHFNWTLQVHVHVSWPPHLTLALVTNGGSYFATSAVRGVHIFRLWPSYPWTVWHASYFSTNEPQVQMFHFGASNWVTHKGTRTVQAYSGSDSDSKSRRKECSLFNTAGAYSGGELQRVGPDGRRQTVYWNDFLNLVSYSVGHQYAKWPHRPLWICFLNLHIYFNIEDTYTLSVKCFRPAIWDKRLKVYTNQVVVYNSIIMLCLVQLITTEIFFFIF